MFASGNEAILCVQAASKQIGRNDKETIEVEERYKNEMGGDEKVGSRVRWERGWQAWLL